MTVLSCPVRQRWQRRIVLPSLQFSSPPPSPVWRTAIGIYGPQLMLHGSWSNTIQHWAWQSLSKQSTSVFLTSTSRTVGASGTDFARASERCEIGKLPRCVKRKTEQNDNAGWPVLAASSMTRRPVCNRVGSQYSPSFYLTSCLSKHTHLLLSLILQCVHFASRLSLSFSNPLTLMIRSLSLSLSPSMLVSAKYLSLRHIIVYLYVSSSSFSFSVNQRMVSTEETRLLPAGPSPRRDPFSMVAAATQRQQQQHQQQQQRKNSPRSSLGGPFSIRPARVTYGPGGRVGAQRDRMLIGCEGARGDTCERDAAV